MAIQPQADEPVDLLLVVERLSMQDQRRIVRLITLLCHAPEWLRVRTQQILQDLVAREPHAQEDCLARIDEIIGKAEQELECHFGVSLRVDGLDISDDTLRRGDLAD